MQPKAHCNRASIGCYETAAWTWAPFQLESNEQPLPLPNVSRISPKPFRTCSSRLSKFARFFGCFQLWYRIRLQLSRYSTRLESNCPITCWSTIWAISLPWMHMASAIDGYHFRFDNDAISPRRSPLAVPSSDSVSQCVLISFPSPLPTLDRPLALALSFEGTCRFLFVLVWGSHSFYLSPYIPWNYCRSFSLPSN